MPDLDRRRLEENKITARVIVHESVDRVEQVGSEHLPVWSCVEKRCEGFPMHAHSGRAYLVMSRK